MRIIAAKVRPIGCLKAARCLPVLRRGLVGSAKAVGVAIFAKVDIGAVILAAAFAATPSGCPWSKSLVDCNRLLLMRAPGGREAFAVAELVRLAMCVREDGLIGDRTAFWDDYIEAAAFFCNTLSTVEQSKKISCNRVRGTGKTWVV